MRSTAKHFTFNNASVILPLGVQDPHTAMSSRTKGTNYFFIFSDSGAQYPTDNFIFDFTNLYVDGKAITAADQLDNNSKAKNNPMTFKSDGSYTPPKKNGQTVNWTAPDRVYAGTLQLMFSGEVKKDGTTWLLPADEIKAFLRKPDAKVTTVKKDGADYVRSTDLVSAGMAAKVEEKDGALVITPAYNGENLLLPDKGEISNLQERACYLVDLITQKDAEGVYYTARNIKDPTAGIWRLITDEAKMYGAGTYKLTFKARSDAAGKLSAGLRTEISEKSKSFSIGSSWAEYTYEFTVTEAEAAGCLALWFAPNVTPYVTQFDVRDISLTKVN
jgi:hypothetical protein